MPRTSASVLQRQLSTPTTLQPLQFTVFCDLDGPLINVSERYYRTYEWALGQIRDSVLKGHETAALTPLSRQQFSTMKQARVPDAEIAVRSGLPEKYIDAFLATVRRIVNQPALLQCDRPQLGAGYALAQLHRVGIPVAVVTLRQQQQAVQVLERFELMPWLSAVRGTQDHGAAYDNYVDCKQALLAEMMAHPQFAHSTHFWMIGDTEADILAAQALGISTIALTCGMRSHAYLARLQPHYIYPSLLSAAQCLLEAAVKRAAPL